MTHTRIRHAYSLSVGVLLCVPVTLTYLTSDQQAHDSVTFTLCCVAAVACSFGIQWVDRRVQRYLQRLVEAGTPLPSGACTPHWPRSRTSRGSPESHGAGASITTGVTTAR